MAHKSILAKMRSAQLGYPGNRVARLEDLFAIYFYTQMAFSFHNNNCFFIFKTSRYNGKCDRLWVW